MEINKPNKGEPIEVNIGYKDSLPDICLLYPGPETEFLRPFADGESRILNSTFLMDQTTLHVQHHITCIICEFLKNYKVIGSNDKDIVEN